MTTFHAAGTGTTVRWGLVALWLALLALGLAALAPAQPPTVINLPRCDSVFGIGDLSVAQYTDGEPLVVVGEFRIAIASASELAAHIDSDPESLDWYDAQ